MEISDQDIDEKVTVPRRRNTDLTVSELKSAAREQLIACGFAGLSIKPILDKAGVSRGALFHHFPTKNHLIAAAFSDQLDLFASELQAAGADLRAEKCDLDTFVQRVSETFASDLFIGSMEIALGIRVEIELSHLVAESVGRWRSNLKAFWRDTFSLPGMDTNAADQHWVMASNLLRGHAFSSTYGVEAGAREAFCKNFKRLILSEAVIRKEAA